MSVYRGLAGLKADSGPVRGLLHLLFTGEKASSPSPPRETLVSQETSSLEALCKQRFEISTWPYQLHGQCLLHSSPRCPGSAAAGGEGVRPRRVGSGNRNKPNPTTPPCPTLRGSQARGREAAVGKRHPSSLGLCVLPLVVLYTATHSTLGSQEVA